MAVPLWCPRPTRLFPPHMAAEVSLRRRIPASLSNECVSSLERVETVLIVCTRDLLCLTRGPTWSVIPKLWMRESHGGAARGGHGCFGDGWSVGGANLSALRGSLRGRSWLMRLLLPSYSLSLLCTVHHPVGRTAQQGARFFSERGRARANPQPSPHGWDHGPEAPVHHSPFCQNRWSCITTVKSNPACEKRVYGMSNLQLFI